MKPKFTFFIAIAIYCSFALCNGEKTYDSKYDSVDVDEILKSERLLTNYIKCLLGEGPCTPDGQDLKDTLPDAIVSDCSQCTEPQKEKSDKIMHFIIDNRPDDWSRLEEKYDASGKYQMAYLESKASDGEESMKNNNGGDNSTD